MALPGITVVVEDFTEGPPESVRKFELLVAAIKELQSLGTNIAQVQNQQGVAAAPCELLAFSFDADYIGVTSGRIAGRMPEHFNPGGIPVFKIGVSGDKGFIYAVATADLATLQWTKSEVLVYQEMQNNTTTKSFTLIGTYLRGTGNPQALIVQGTCGPVNPDICSLLPG